MVQLVAISVTSPFSFDFNTSYVMVQLRVFPIPLFLLNNFNTSYVMVQLESVISRKSASCRFQYILCYGSTCAFSAALAGQLEISIHLMLWFNYDNKPVYPYGYRISIHLMLWFNSAELHLVNLRVSYFNTSYVMVQLCKNTVFILPDCISIHLMLWFNYLRALAS